MSAENTSLTDLFARMTAQPSLQLSQTQLQSAGRDLERALRAALKEQSLLGLPNLGTRVQPYYGLNLDSLLGDGSDSLPFPTCDRDEGSSRIVLSERGYITAVHMTRRRPKPHSGSWNAKPWFEVSVASGFPQLAPKHLTTLTHLLPKVLLEHLRLSSKMQGDFVDALKRAGQLTDALKDGDR